MQSPVRAGLRSSSSLPAVVPFSLPVLRRPGVHQGSRRCLSAAELARAAADITACVDAVREAQGREVSMAHFSGRRRLMIHLGAETRRALAITARATCYGPAPRSKGRLEGLAVAGLGCHGAGRKKAREWRGAWEDDRRLARAVRANASASASLHRGRGRTDARGRDRWGHCDRKREMAPTDGGTMAILGPASP